MGAGPESQVVNLKSIIKLSKGKGEKTKACYFVLFSRDCKLQDTSLAAFSSIQKAARQNLWKMEWW